MWGRVDRRPDGSVGMALVLPALTDCRWWIESLLVHSGVSSATRRKATGADHKNMWGRVDLGSFAAGVRQVGHRGPPTFANLASKVGAIGTPSNVLLAVTGSV